MDGLSKNDQFVLEKIGELGDKWFFAHDLPAIVMRPAYCCQRLFERGRLHRMFNTEHKEWRYKLKAV